MVTTPIFGHLHEFLIETFLSLAIRHFSHSVILTFSQKWNVIYISTLAYRIYTTHFKFYADHVISVKHVLFLVERIYHFAVFIDLKV